MEQGYAIGGRCQAIPADTRGEDLLAERILLPAECGGTAIATVQRLSIE
jgi:hypothetical protein